MDWHPAGHRRTFPALRRVPSRCHPRGWRFCEGPRGLLDPGGIHRRAARVAPRPARGAV